MFPCTSVGDNSSAAPLSVGDKTDAIALFTLLNFVLVAECLHKNLIPCLKLARALITAHLDDHFLGILQYSNAKLPLDILHSAPFSDHSPWHIMVSDPMLNPIPISVHFWDYPNFGALSDIFLWSMYITISPYNKQKDACRANKSKFSSQETNQR